MRRGLGGTVAAFVVAATAVAVAGPTAAQEVEAATHLSPPGVDARPIQEFGDLERLAMPTVHQVLSPVDIAPDPATDGYWRTDAVGRVEASGGAAHHGDALDIDLVAAIVAIAPTPTGLGYWLAAADGGVFSFGDADFFGSMGGTILNSPVVDMVSTPTGNGYWLIAADGGVFSFGDADFFGSMGGTILNSPVVGAAGTPSGGGYWMAGADGGVFSFGDADFFGSVPGLGLTRAVMGFDATPGGDGYWVATTSGSVFDFGAAPSEANDNRFDAPDRTAFAASDDGNGYWITNPSSFAPVALFETIRPTLATAVDTNATTELLPAGTVVQTTGRVERGASGDDLVEIRDRDDAARLVRYDDLVLSATGSPDTGALPCDASGPQDEIVSPNDSGLPTRAVEEEQYVSAVDHRVFADGCERITIHLGEEVNGETVPIDQFPFGVAFFSTGATGHMYLPLIGSQDPFITVQTAGVGERAELVTAVRLARPAGSGEQEVRIFADTDRQMRGTFLESPARLVVDIGDETLPLDADPPTSIGPPLSTTLDNEAFAVISRLEVDGGNVTVEGIARTFEAVAEVELRFAPFPDGSGNSPVSATFTGVLGGTRVSSNASVSLTDWISAWGEFSFEIEGLAPGVYEIFVGELVQDPTFGREGVTRTFVVI